jgi:hypothetical protein
MRAQARHSATPGQIQRTALILAVPTTTQFSATWAGNRGACWFGYQHEAPILLDNDQHDLPAVCSGTQELGHDGLPRLPR